MNRYRGNAKLTSQFAVLKSRGGVTHIFATAKKGPVVTTKITTDYALPLVREKKFRKNKIVFSSKYFDRSTKDLKRHDINVNMDNKNFPEGNFAASALIAHKDRYTKSALTVNHGPKARTKKDKNRQLTVEMNVNHKLAAKSALVTYNTKVVYPLKAIEYQFQGKHEHHLGKQVSFENYNSIIFAKGKNIEIRINGKDSSKKNLDASGSLEIVLPSFEIGKRKTEARNYKLLTTIKQRPNKEYLHTVNLQTDNGKHTMVTKFLKSGQNDFTLFSEMDMGNSPNKVRLDMKKVRANMDASVKATTEKGKYNMEVSFEERGYRNRIILWDFDVPDRRIKGSLEGIQKKVKNYKSPKWILNFVTSPDFNREPSKKIEAELRYFVDYETKEKINDIAVSVMTPYKDAEIFTYERTAKVSPMELIDYFKVVWGSKEKELSSFLWMHLPPSMERFEIKYNLVTPSEKVKNAGFDIVHKFDSKKYLSSSVKVMHNSKEFSIALLAANKGDLVRNDIESSLQIKSNFKRSVKNIFLELKHNDDGRIYSTEVSYNRNGLRHKAILQATYVRVHWQAQIDADLEIQIPRERPMTIRFKHLNTLTNLNSSLTFIWKTEADAKLNIGGKFNKAEKDYALDILYNGPVDDFSDFELQYRHNEMGDMSGSLYYSVNKNPTWTSRTLYKHSNSETSVESNGHKHSFVLKASYSRYPYTVFISNVGPMSEKAEADEKIVLEASLDKDSKTAWSSNIRLLTPFEGIRNTEVRGSLRGDRRAAQRTDWTLDGTVEFDVRKEITVAFTVDPNTWTQMHGSVKTPFDELTLLSFGFDRSNSGKLYNTKSYSEKHSFDSYLEMQPLFSRSKMEFSTQLSKRQNTSRLFLDMPDTELQYLEINTEVTEVRRGAKTHIKVNYHSDKEIDLTFKGRFNKNRLPENTKLSLDLVTPYKAFPTLNMNVNLEKEKGKWLGDINMVSTSDHFKHFDIHVEQEHSETSSHSDIAIASSLFETVEAGMHFNWGDTAAANVTLRAPSVGRTMIGFKRHSESWTDFQNKIFAEFNGYNLDADVGLKHDDMETKAWILFAHPGSDDGYVDISTYRIGNSMMDFDIGGFLQIGKNSKPFNVSAQFSFVENRKNAIGFTLATPTTKDLSYLVKYEKVSEGQTEGKLYAKYGEIFLLDYFSTEEKATNSIKSSSGYRYKYYDTIVNSGTFYSVRWSETFHEGIVKMYFLDHKLDMEVLHRRLRDGLDTLYVSLTTPWEEFTDIGLEAGLERNNDHIEGSGKLEYMNDNEAELTFDLKPQSGNTITLTSELLLPVEGYEQNTLTYSQTLRKNAFTAEAELITGKGEHLNGNLRFKDKSEFDLKLEGPIEDFETLIISGTYNADQIKIDGDAQLKLKLNPKPVRLEYNIHVNKNPVDMHLKLTSPYKNIRNVDLTITHRGKDWKKFTTISELQSEVLGTMLSKTMWDYDSPTQMLGRSMFTSEIENFENVKVGVATRRKQGDQVSRVVVSWAEGKEVAVENAWKLQKDRKKSKFITSLDVTSPFEKMKKVNIKLSHTKGQKAFSEEIFIQHNDRTYLDTDVSYQFADGHEGTVDIRSPRPMSLFVTGKGGSGLFDGKIKFVWDKRSPDSQVVIESKLADQSDSYGIDKSFKFKVIHPVRIMGLDCLYKNDNNELLSSGLITWDEEDGKTFSYDLGWSNRTSRYSKMFSGHLKLGVPHRSVKVQGSYEDQGNSVSTSHAVFWDADKDDTKKVVLATTQETRNKMKRVSVNLNLPSINKQLNIGVSSKEGYGSTLMDCKAEVSYSSDPNKMLVVTSKLTNAVDVNEKDQYNYTLDLSLEHPVTDTNFQIVSHLASIDGICSSGSELTFLTAQKKKKTLSWWGRWNRPGRKAELQVVTPLKTVGIEGTVEEIANRQHFSLRSFEDGKQALKFGVLVDPRRRNMRLEFNYDQDDAGKMLAVSGQYIDDSAVEFDVVSYDGRMATSESMITVRLNSSHFLHTRILWRPTMLSDLKTFVGTKVTAFSYAADLAFKQSVASLGAEVKARYVRITEELREELSQVFELMEKEMDSLSSQLETLRIKARRFYQRNDLRFRDLSENLKEMVDQLLVDIQKASKNYRNYYKQVTQATKEWLVDLKTYPISQRYTQAVLDFITALKETRQLLEDTLDTLIVEMQKFSDVSYKKYLELSRSIDRKLNSYRRLLIELPMYKKMLKQREDLARLGEKTIPNWAHIYDGLYLKGQELLQDQFHDMMSRDEFKHAHAMVTELHQQFMYWNTEKSLSQGLQRLMSVSKNLLLMEVAKLKGSLIDMKKSRVIVFDPERGELQLEIHLPIGLKSLSEPPQFNAGKYLNKLKTWTKSKLPATNASIWDNDYIPSLEPESWVPPYDATGYLIGSQQLITFDKTSHSFLSSCSQVLARDMLHDKFLVTANYERNARQNGIKSVCVTVDYLSIEVGENYKVLVNNREVEMPYITDKVRVLRSADSISVEYTDGLDVIVNPKLDLYKVKISGWYHGRTAGLLGMYDNEKINEKDLSDFSQDFEVNKRSCNNKNVALTPDARQDKNGLCHQLFEEPSSKFRPCFRQVSSKPFFELCQMYMATKSEEKAVYLSTEQYRSVCQDQGVYMGALKEYEHLPCSSKEFFKVEGSDPRYQSADVLFVVEDSSCNKWTSDSLAPLVTELNKELLDAGMKKNQFGLIGFGGVAVTDATVRTLNGQHFGQASVFLKAVETLSMTDKRAPGDIFSAIELATKYPFRPGVAKILVLAPCIFCDAAYQHQHAASVLKSQGFIVHALRDMRFPPLANRPGADRIYGMDATHMYTNQLTQDGFPKEGIATPTAVPDDCQAILTATNGSLFDTRHLIGTPQVKREFMKSFAQHVAWRAKLPECQQCQCDGNSGQVRCFTCQSDSYLSFLPSHIPSLPEAMGAVGDFGYEVKNYFAFKK